MAQGKNDPRVPYTEAEQVVKALKDRGAVVEYKLYDDEGREYRVCPQCAYNMYKQGRMWVCENCGYSYVE